MRGFVDPALESQRVFRAIMDAMARPASVQPLATGVRAPAPLSPELAAIALTLADGDAALWLDTGLRAQAGVVHYLRFHTGARIIDEPAAADFALISDAAACPPLSAFSVGTALNPEQSTTLVLQTATLDARDGPRFTGPGVRRRTQASKDGTSKDGASEGMLRASALPPDFLAQACANHAMFPLGVDLVFVAPGAVSALPRSSAPLRDVA